MRRQHGPLSWIWLFVVLAVGLAPQAAVANGMYFTSSLEGVASTTQQAVLVIDEEGFDLHLQTGFSDGAEPLGWVVPVPDVPEVSSSSDELFAELSLLTTPFFVHHCYCCCHETGFCPAGGDDAADYGVTIFASGVLGDLDWVVLTGGSGEGLTDWLDANGFAMVEGAEALVDEYLAEGFLFFAARVAPDASGEGAVPAVRLRFDAGVEPLFPMRLTALSAPEPVPILLFVAASSAYVPTSYPWALAPDQDVTREEYAAAIEALQGQEEGRTFVVEHARTLFDQEDYRETGGETGDEYFDSAVTSGLPETFDPVVQRILDEELVVTRLSATLAADAMTEDVLFEPSEVHLTHVHQYATHDGPCCPYCPSGDGCECSLAPAASAHQGSSAALLGLLVALLLVARWRLRGGQ